MNIRTNSRECEVEGGTYRRYLIQVAEVRSTFRRPRNSPEIVNPILDRVRIQMHRLGLADLLTIPQQKRTEKCDCFARERA